MIYNSQTWIGWAFLMLIPLPPPFILESATMTGSMVRGFYEVTLDDGFFFQPVPWKEDVHVATMGPDTIWKTASCLFAGCKYCPWTTIGAWWFHHLFCFYFSLFSLIWRIFLHPIWLSHAYGAHVNYSSNASEQKKSLKLRDLPGNSQP